VLTKKDGFWESAEDASSSAVAFSPSMRRPAQSGRGQACLSCTPVDMIYAAIAEANGCILVTDNEERFTGLNVLNPIKPLSS